jgi:hypothetical protein
VRRDVYKRKRGVWGCGLAIVIILCFVGILVHCGGVFLIVGYIRTVERRGMLRSCSHYSFGVSTFLSSCRNVPPI